MSEHVGSVRSGSVLTLTLDRSAAKNALTHAMYTALAEGLEEAEASAEIRCVVLTGSGDAFTAGNDLGDFGSALPEGELPVLRFLRALRDSDVPILAAVNGVAVGVGLTMLLHCDLVFAAESARLSAPFTRVGLVPEAGSSLLLPEAVGMAWANDILLAGRVLTAAEALAVGLVSRVVPDAELSSLAAAVAEQVAGMGPTSMRESKRLIRRDRGRVAERMEQEAEVFLRQLASPEFAESVRAMKEKRKPVFD